MSRLFRRTTAGLGFVKKWARNSHGIAKEHARKHRSHELPRAQPIAFVIFASAVRAMIRRSSLRRATWKHGRFDAEIATDRHSALRHDPGGRAWHAHAPAHRCDAEAARAGRRQAADQ